MRNLFLAKLLCVLSALFVAFLMRPQCLMAQGGLDRQSPEIRTLFEEGNYFEVSWAAVSPDLSGTGGFLDPGGFGTGDLFESYDQWAFALKTNLTNRTSLGLILDQPWGVDTLYPTIPTSGYSGTSADLNSNELSAILRHQIGYHFSGYAGIRFQSVEADVTIPFAGLLGLPGPYSAVAERDEGVGFVAGGAWELPDIKFRFAATYYSEIETSHDTLEIAGTTIANTTTNVSTPQSINLDLQSGVAKNTLAFASARWVDWSKFDISPPFFTGALGAPLVEFTEDFFTYTVGIGRKINERFSIAFLVKHTPSTGQVLTTLGPVDGRTSYLVAPTVKFNRMKITTLIGYSNLGAATNFAGTEFDNGGAFIVGTRLGFNF